MIRDWALWPGPRVLLYELLVRDAFALGLRKAIGEKYTWRVVVIRGLWDALCNLNHISSADVISS